MPARKKPASSRSAAQDPPTVAAVRAIRRRMWKEAGGDIATLMEMARREAATVRTAKRIPTKRRGPA